MAARATSAWHIAAAEQRRRTEWLAIGLPHNSSHLFARLAFDDAVGLAVLVGTGQMTWAEINAALDARIKLAIGQDDRSPDPHQIWEQARRTAEDEIWARYHAKCDAIFADGTAEEAAHPGSREQLRDREQILHRLRDARDRALLALSQRMSPPPQSSRATPSIQARIQLTANEHDALGKLQACGFAGSQLMADAIRDLAAPLAGSIANSA